jgi:hypothetical protein
VAVGEGRKAVFYYVLKVSGEQSSANGAGQWGVVRRYSDFEALRTKIMTLTAEDTGVPPALLVDFPPKTSWFSSAEEVVAERRLGLGQWLIAIRAVLMGAQSDEKGMVAAIREMRQFLAADDSVKDLGPGPVGAQVTASLGVLRAGNGGHGDHATTRAGGPAPEPEGRGGRGAAGGGPDVLDQLGDMVSSTLGVAKAMNKEGNRQNKLLGAAAEATDRGRDGVGDMLDTYAYPHRVLNRIELDWTEAPAFMCWCRMHAQGMAEATAKDVRVHNMTRGGGGGRRG